MVFGVHPDGRLATLSLNVTQEQGFSCKPEYTLECPDNGLCPASQTFQNNSDDPSTCSCQGGN